MNNLRILNQELNRRWSLDTYSSDSYPSKYKTKTGQHIRLFSDPPPRALPYSNDTSGVLLLLLLLVYVMGWMNDLRGCVEAPYIAWIGRFPGEKSARTLAIDVGMAVATFLPKLRGPGTCPGSAKLGVRPAPLCRLCPPSFAGWLVSGPSWLCVGAGASFVGLLYFVGPLWKCDARLDILCNCVASFVCFCLIPHMGSCNPRITKTCGNC